MLQLNGTVLLRHAGTPSIRPLQRSPGHPLRPEPAGCAVVLRRRWQPEAIQL